MAGKIHSFHPLYLTSLVSTFIFAMIYGLIEHTLLASPMGISVLVYPLDIHLVGQLYFYHFLMVIMAILVCFNPFFDKLFFTSSNMAKRQALLWGTGNILSFIWLEDMFYFVLFAEWPKDVMTPFQVSFYGVVWWYPVLLGISSFLYYHAVKSTRTIKVDQRVIEED